MSEVIRATGRMESQKKSIFEQLRTIQSEGVASVRIKWKDDKGKALSTEGFISSLDDESVSVVDFPQFLPAKLTSIPIGAINEVTKILPFF